MSNFFIDIYEINPGGQGLGIEQEYTPVGNGPLRDIIKCQATQRLNRGGNWSFEIHAQDPKAQFIAPNKFLQCNFTTKPFENDSVFGGQITNVNMIGEGRNERLLVEGVDPLGELTKIILTNDVVFTSDSNSPGTILTLANNKATASVRPNWYVVVPFLTTTSLTATIPKLTTSLEALILISDRLGEHFRMEGGRAVRWVGPVANFADTGLLAVGNGDPSSLQRNSNVLVVQSFERVNDAQGVVTRLFPLATGVGEEPHTLANVTDPAPAGYTVNSTDNYIEDTTATASQTLHEHSHTFSDIKPAGSATADLEAASNQLQTAAAEYLRTRKQSYDFYRLRVALNNQIIRVGQYIHTDIRRVLNQNVPIDLRDKLIIIENKVELSPDGNHVATLLCATVDRWPVDELDDFILQSVGNN